jgi:hypothetical protein
MMDLDGSWEIELADIQYPHSWYSIKQGEAWVHVDVYLKAKQLQRHTFELPAGYYSKTLVTISASLPSNGTILNSGT